MNAETFWSLVTKPETDGACWPFHGSGYAVNGGRKLIKINRRSITAQRAAWELTHGKRPSGKVKNSCGVSDCVNPAHLYCPGEQSGVVLRIRVAAPRPATPSPLRSRQKEARRFTQAQADLMHKALCAIEAHDLWGAGPASKRIARLTLDQVNGRLVTPWEGAAS